MPDVEIDRLTLHAESGSYTAAARSVLEDGASLWDAASG